MSWKGGGHRYLCKVESGSIDFYKAKYPIPPPPNKYCMRRYLIIHNQEDLYDSSMYNPCVYW